MAKVAFDTQKYAVQFADSPSGRKIQYTIVGACGPEDPVLLFCPGNAFPGMPATWQVFAAQNDDTKWKDDKCKELVEAMAWTIVIVERAGYQKSSLNKKVEDWTLDDAAVDYIAVMDALKLDKFAILGASSGGCNALHVAYKYPDRVSAILLNCANANFGPGFPKGKKANEKLPDGAPITYVNPAASMISCAKCCRWNPCCCCCCCCPNGLWADMYVDIKPQPFKYEDIKCPVLVVGGMADTAVESNQVRYHASKLPNSKLLLVDGMKHVTFPGKVWTEKMAELREHALGKPLQNEMSQ
jgi:pimeloyl-ACP methyl ester carboxylesterase